MTDDILTLNESGEMSVRTTSSAGDTSTNKNDVYTRDSQGRLALRVVGATGGGGGTVSGDYVRQYAEMPEPNSAGNIVQYIGNSAPYSHGAFYESTAKILGSNRYTDFYGHVDVVVESTDTMFKFINAVLEHAGKSPLAVGDSVKVQQLLDTDGFPIEMWIEITPTGGVADRTDVDIEWLMTREDFMQSGLGFSMSGTEDYMTFTVSGIATTTFVWQETTVDVALEAMVENYGSILKSPVELSSRLGAIKRNVSGLTALVGLDARPSHVAEGAVVVDDYGKVGIVDSVRNGRIDVVSVYIPASGLPTTNGAYKVLGTDTTTTPKWVEAVLIDDFQPSDVSAGYLGSRPFISKTGAYDAIQNQSYIISQQSIESKYTLVSDTSNGQIQIVDPTAFYAYVQERWLGSYGGYGSITELAVGQTITLNVVADDYHGVENMQYNAEIAISDESGGNFTGNNMYFTASDLQQAGIESTLTAGGSYSLVIRIDAIGSSGYILESAGCAKIVGATDSSSTYAFSMPANMVQMGGIVEVGNLNASVAVGNIPVVLPVACKNVNYVPTITIITDGTFKQIIADVANRTTTGFEICVRNIDTEAANNVKIAWSVVGLKG